jgi:hypothetical protein
VYALTDPDTGEERYVGTTGNSVNRRIDNHMSIARSAERGAVPMTARSKWLLSLNGRQPNYRILAEVTGDAFDSEREWIARLLTAGAALTNITGNPTYSAEMTARGFPVLTPAANDTESGGKLSVSRGGVRLREILSESGETQQALEKRLGLVRGYVGDAISGRARPSYSKRARFNVELGIPLDLWDVDAKTEKEATS